MKVWQSALFFLVIFAGVLFWRRSTVHAPTPARPAGLPEPDPAAAAVLPGSDVSIVLARGALIIEGDIADPIENVRLARADKPDETIAFDSGSATPVKFIGFFNVEAGQHYFAEVKTKHRSVVRQLTQPEKVQPVEIQRIPIHVRAANTAKPNVVFSPDGKLVAISTDTGELKLLPVFGGDARIDKRPSKGVQSLAFSADSSRLVTLDCGEKTIVHCFETAMGGEVWSKQLVDDEMPKTDRIRSGEAHIFGDVFVVYDNGRDTHWELARLELAAGALKGHSRNGQSRSTEAVQIPTGLELRSACSGSNGIFMAIHGDKEDVNEHDDIRVIDANEPVADLLPAQFERPHDWAGVPTICSSQLTCAYRGKRVLVGMSDAKVYCLETDEKGGLVMRWRVDTGGIVETKDGSTYCLAISVCGLIDRTCFVTGPAVVGKRPGYVTSLSWDSINPNACAAHIVDLADGQKIMKLPVDGIPRFCASSNDGRWLTIGSGVGPPVAGEKQKLDLFDCASTDRSVPPRLTYSSAMKDLGATFSPDGRLLAVVTDSETPANPKDEEKTVDLVIIH